MMENNRPHKSFPQTPFCVSAAPSPSMIRSHAPLSGQRLRTNRIGSTVPGANGFCSEEEFTGICSQDCPRIEHKTPSICFLSFSHLRIKNLPVTATLLEGKCCLRADCCRSASLCRTESLCSSLSVLH